MNIMKIVMPLLHPKLADFSVDRFLLKFSANFLASKGIQRVQSLSKTILPSLLHVHDHILLKFNVQPYVMLLTVYYARLSVRPHTLAAATPSVNVPSSWQVTDQNKAELVQVRHNLSCALSTKTGFFCCMNKSVSQC